MRAFCTQIIFLLLCAGSALAQADFRVVHVIPGPYLRPGTYPFTLGLENLGAQGGAFRVFWQVDNGPITGRLPYTPGGLNGYAGETQVISDSFKVTVAAGDRKFKVWVVPLNGLVDANRANDTFVHNLRVMTELPDKNVVLEIYKHQICGPCYPAAEFNHQFIEPNPAYSVVNLYTDPNDVIYNADAAAINLLYNFAHPAPMFDRYKFPYLHDIMTGYFTLNNVYQLRELGRRDVMYEPLGVSIAYMNLDTPSRLLRVRLKAKAVDTIAGDLRFNLWITEDSIKAYQASAPNPNNYWHSNVLRSFVGGQWGVAGSMPSRILPGQEVFYDFQYTIPANYVLKRLNVIGLVQTYATDKFARRIVNSVRARATKKLSVSSTSTRSDIRVFPNPAKERIWVKRDNASTEKLHVSIRNTIGQLVLEQDMASQLESIDLTRLPAGNYMLRVSGESGRFDASFVRVE